MFRNQMKANCEMKKALIKSQIELDRILTNTLIQLTPYENKI